MSSPTRPDQVEPAIQAYLDASLAYAAAVQRELELTDARPLAKNAAVQRIMAAQGLAATPAEKLVESDPAYAAHLAALRVAVVQKLVKHGETAAAKLRAQVACAIVAQDAVDLVAEGV